MRSVTIEVPMMPPRETNPNYRAHWSAKAAAVAEYRECAGFAALGARVGRDLGWVRDGAVMDVEVAWAGRRKAMDDDNLVAAVKPARDGIADCFCDGEDGRIRVGQVRQTRGEGVTIVTLRELGDTGA